MCVQDIWIGRHTVPRTIAVTIPGNGQIPIPARADRLALSVTALGTTNFIVHAGSDTGAPAIGGLKFFDDGGVGPYLGFVGLYLSVKEYGQAIMGELLISGDAGGDCAVVEYYSDPLLERAIKRESAKHAK